MYVPTLLFRSVFGRNSFGVPVLGATRPMHRPPSIGVITCAVLDEGMPEQKRREPVEVVGAAPLGASSRRR